ncbi:hypothetical protein C0J08_10625 [Marinomonas sp. CT5]|uniref:hypothetical protein n=1 Tax=Marinomonas sp. CT5 TaxID=2066133 RepID=UPI001BB04E70|nr:hypothetical protein [Marinomonas sp. CT5]QUX95844.1 hypothetical protein C0J08_10625 [Marinomonas sp. CT5]
MNKSTMKLVGVSSLTILLSGCSTFFTDHSVDYQEEKAVSSTLVVPKGSEPSQDVLVIPNEDKIADLEPTKSFTIPRAPFVYYPMVAIDVDEQSDLMVFSVPTSKEHAKRIVTDFLTALHGAGESVASETENEIVSVPFDFHQQGWWASLWSSITRVYPAQTAFLFQFKEQGEKTAVSIQFRDEQKDTEPSDWLSPVQNDDAYSVAVRLWGVMGRQLKQSSAYLSNLNEESSFPIWVDHHGTFAIYLGNNVTTSDVEAKLSAADMYLMPGEDHMLAPVPSEDVARIGDVVDFSIPTGNGEKQKLFNVRRRNLDDVSWDLREYHYEISHQKVGDFLVIDVSKMDMPEVVSYHLAQRFVN